MDKSVLISIRPKWCEMIANGKKTIELKKSRPKLETPFKCYIYCTACSSFTVLLEHMPFGNDELYRDVKRNIKYGCSIELMAAEEEDYDSSYFLNRKVIGEFICDDIDEVSVYHDTIYCVNNTQPKKLKQMCLTLDDVISYLGEGNHGYTWHISDLKIYDTPKELSNFLKPCPYGDVSCFLCDKSGYNADMHIDCFNTVNRPPRSWMYVAK